jgi:hypothetical protein
MWKNGEIMQIWWEKNEVFREKPEPVQLFPQVPQPDLELSNSQISITDLEREIGTSQSFF